MKKLHLLFAVLLLAGTANAQFFQRVYGTPQSRDVLESGMNYDYPALPVTQKGYVMAGFTNFNSTGTISPMVTRTFLNGAPAFNNTYPLNFYGRAVDAAARRVITYPNGRIGVIGDWSFQPGAQHTNVFYMLLNPNGGVAGVWAYFFQNVQSIEATSITPSVAPSPQQNAYACGNITDFSGRRYPFAMCVNAFTGAIVWGHDYADVGMGSPDWTVEDLIESPYANQYTGTLDVALVGRHSLAAGGFGDGHWFTVDALTGGVSSRVYLYGTPNSEDNFNAITIANNPFPNGVRGFAIAGSSTDYTVPAPNSNMWAIKIGPNGNVVDFSSLMDYSLGNRNDFGFDIVERFSPTLARYQYFVGGDVDQGVHGAQDPVVYKLDDTGNPYAGPGGLNQFTFGGGGFDRILQLDYYQNGVLGNNIGLSSFSQTLGSFPILGQNDFYHVKSYFNGITPLGAVGGTGNCNHDEQWMNWLVGPPLLDSTKADTVLGCKQDLLAAQIVPMQNGIICQQNGVAGGDNVRLASPADLGAIGSTLFPNPVSRTNAVVNLAFDVPGYGDAVELELYNSIGQVVMHKRETLGDGQMTLQVNLGDGLSTGVYSLVVRREGELTTHKIAVE
jgi:hypothetical protein